MIRCGRDLLVAVAVVGAALATQLPGTTSAAAAPAPTSTPTTTSTPSPSTTSAAPGATDPALLIVMDTSSSMDDADASGGTRLAGAKTAVTDFISTLPETARVGLNTYPGGSGGECGAGTEAIPIATASLQEMDAYVRSLGTGGSTPTGLALRKAGDDLLASGSKAGVVILVSDGESNCESSSPDPCAVAKELADKGLDITVNTVGFQISDAGKAELQCIADATGGAYVDVSNGEELSKEITSYSVPKLEMTLDPADQTVALEPGADNDVVIAATVRNTGEIVAPNVEATVTYDASFSPGSAAPRHRLGNLAPGQSASFTWRFRPTDEFNDRTVRFKAIASTRNFQTAPVPGSVRFRRSTSTAGLPGWLRDARHIVVLGDSYSSGEGTGTADPKEGRAFDEPTDEPYNSCHRSRAHTTAGYVSRLTRNGATVHVLACSGAKTVAMWSAADQVDAKTYNTVDGTKHAKALPSQLRQLEDLDVRPDLIMMTVGGNDAGFQSIVVDCLLWTFCTPPFPWMKSAQETFTEGIRGLPTDLQTTYRSVARVAEERAGHPVPILVPAYPVPFPLDGSKPCIASAQLFSPWTRAFLNSVALATNSFTEQQVALARSHGIPVWFVEKTAGAFQAGHTYCDTDSWINRITLENLVSLGADAYVGVQAKYSLPDYLSIIRTLVARTAKDHVALLAFRNMLHPTRKGYEAEAVQLITWATRHPSLQVAPTKATERTVRSGSGDASSVPSSVRTKGTIALTSSAQVTVAPGSVYLATGGGFAPGTDVSFTVRSDPELAAGVPADDSGSVAAGIWIRPDLPLGTHHLVATGVGDDGRPRTLTVALKVQRPLPAWWWPGVALAGLTAAGALVCTGLWVRRRPARSQVTPR